MLEWWKCKLRESRDHLCIQALNKYLWIQTSVLSVYLFLLASCGLWFLMVLSPLSYWSEGRHCRVARAAVQGLCSDWPTGREPHSGNLYALKTFFLTFNQKSKGQGRSSSERICHPVWLPQILRQGGCLCRRQMMTQNSSWGWKRFLGLRVPLGGGKELAHSVSKEMGQPLVWVVLSYLIWTHLGLLLTSPYTCPPKGKLSLAPFNLRKWYLVISILGLGCALFNSVTSTLDK